MSFYHQEFNKYNFESSYPTAASLLKRFRIEMYQRLINFGAVLICRESSLYWTDITSISALIHVFLCTLMRDITKISILSFFIQKDNFNGHCSDFLLLYTYCTFERLKIEIKEV